MEQIGDFGEGVQFAKKMLASLTKPSPYSPKPISQPNATKLQILQDRGFQMIAENPDELVGKADSDPDYFDALRFGAAQQLSLGIDFPLIIRHWIVEYLQGKRVRPKSASGRGSSIGWHINIALTVDLLVRAGMTATRNDASDTTSACDAVARALAELGLPPSSYARVKKIWLDIRRAKDETGVIRFDV
jgi:hypothetical protein